MEFIMRYTYANPSSVHANGRLAARLLAESRTRLAQLIHASPDDIYFTSGGTESNNMVIRNVMDRAACDKIILVNAIEHDSVLNTCETYQQDCDNENIVIKIPCTRHGYVDKNELINLCKTYSRKVRLVCVMFGQNEIGTIQSVNFIVDVVREQCPEALIMVDCTQGMGKYHITVKKLGWPDFVTASAHKFHGPRGVGFVYARRNALNTKFSHQTGGAQEHHMRAGTENLPAIAGMVAALEKMVADPGKLAQRQKNVMEMRDFIHNELIKNLGMEIVQVNGDPTYGLYNTLNITINHPNAKFLAQQLDAMNISVSPASACTKDKPSHVLTALKFSGEESVRTIRISLSENNTKNECKAVVQALINIVNKDRKELQICENAEKKQGRNGTFYTSNGLKINSRTNPQRCVCQAHDHKELCKCGCPAAAPLDDSSKVTVYENELESSEVCERDEPGASNCAAKPFKISF